MGGEPCSTELAARWAGRCRFFNTYGPTETTITATYVEYRDGALPPLIGRPLPNVRVYLLDQALEPVPVGVTGELYIGGIGVARGYLGRPKLSAERFLPDPFRDTPGALMYRSGDFGALAFGRPDRVHRPDRRSGEASRLSHRAGGDRGGSLRASGRAPGGRASVDRKAGRRTHCCVLRAGESRGCWLRSPCASICVPDFPST